MHDPARFESAKQHFLAGVAHLEAGRPAEAEAALRASLALLPGRPSSLTNLGAALLAQDRPAKARAPLEAALQAEPDNLEAWCLLGAAHSALDQPEPALQACAEALRLRPGHPPALFHRAGLLAGQQRYADALTELAPLLDPADPGAAPAWRLAGQCRQALDQLAGAEAAYRQALALDARLPRVHAMLGQLLAPRGPAAVAAAADRAAEAAALHRAAIAAGVDAALNQYLLAGLLATGNAADVEGAPAPPPPPRSPDDYVRALFDPYADDFEQHLVQALHYRGHTLVAEAARAALAARAAASGTPGAAGPVAEAAVPGFAQVLDLGCGTGLCGRLLAPLAGQITGVDLSPTMVAAARRCGAYHEVVEAEALAFVAGCNTPYDLVVAADVFIYIGALAPLFSGLARCQPPGGLLVATVETAAPPDAAAAEAGWWLQPSLRYAHGRDGIARLAEAHGYVLRQWTPAVIREEQRQPIHGAVLVLERLG